MLYGGVCLLAYLVSDRMIFVPPAATYGDTGEVIKLRAPDGVRISAVHLPDPTARFTLLVSHGNAEDLGAVLPWLRRLQGIGFAVFAYDYRGYGTSEGRPSEQGTYADIDVAYSHLTGALGIPPGRVIAYGRSVGTGPAVDLAARRPVGGLVVESGFTTAFRVLTRVPLVPFDKFRNVDKIGRVGCPVLVMHGRDDEVVPFAHGQALWRAAPSPKQSLWVEGAGHNDFWLVAAPRITRALIEFADLAAAPR